ncbi:hypothetical protein ACIOHC_35760 [Streptomyces sp. NPDC088252]|uniref:hypothetical protein n=1 Tax=Streptomyces sp. NPDC088252 TaxID=3365845 RepID=UPI00380ACC73
MALPPQRPMNRELDTGMTEGTYKRRAPNRGGFVEETTNIAREHLSSINYSIAETSWPSRPDESYTLRHQ